MMQVLQMKKVLTGPPPIVAALGISIRTYAGEKDSDSWLALRNLAFGRERIGIRSWNRADFEEEFLAKPWWRPEHLWLATVEAQLVGSVALARRGSVALARHSSVALARRGSPEAGQPAVHWLMVLPAYRRKGIATALMSHLESAAWLAGDREIVLETHSAWERGVAFYQRQGYEVVGES